MLGDRLNLRCGRQPGVEWFHYDLELQPDHGAVPDAERLCSGSGQPADERIRDAAERRHGLAAHERVGCGAAGGHLCAGFDIEHGKCAGALLSGRSSRFAKSADGLCRQPGADLRQSAVRRCFLDLLLLPAVILGIMVCVNPGYLLKQLNAWREQEG